jgi:hypothetical protein
MEVAAQQFNWRVVLFLPRRLCVCVSILHASLSCQPEWQGADDPGARGCWFSVREQWHTWATSTRLRTAVEEMHLLQYGQAYQTVLMGISHRQLRV